MLRDSRKNVQLVYKKMHFVASQSFQACNLNLTFFKTSHPRFYSKKKC